MYNRTHWSAYSIVKGALEKSMARLIAAAIIFGLGVALGIVALVNGHSVVSLALFLAGINVALGALLGIGEYLTNPWFKLSAGALSALSVLAVFLHARAFQPNLEAAHADVLMAFVTVGMPGHPASPKVQDIANFGVKACTLQGNSDQMAAVVDLAKSVYLGPGTSLADAVVSSTHGANPDYCALAYKAVDRIDPTAFIFLSAADRRALFEATK
jgi:hypothetical protein